LGGGFKQGIGQSLGTTFSKAFPNTALVKSPATGITSQVATPAITSTWSKLGEILGKRAMSTTPSRPEASPFPSVDTSTSVQRGRGGYAGSKKKSQIEILLEQLAGR